ncbi:hypothetical protein AMAG_18824 [Allomyces macrogynus ATCC 38327]|uniref:Uncharacterized protein n=1 Tax=Allomyces macrogynus (strain ATCC 38327) TaxID=578462 RepID=A0A0L0SI46_ALLM3|nr:hypothetical protein AMAG_18824 [Allomyces macrogynus ATCC 38327]|eukprot:KNE62186.1 hypothetical protein AMAG_18824 [Allomyces macrogynus ATCC 38327]
MLNVLLKDKHMHVDPPQTATTVTSTRRGSGKGRYHRVDSVADVALANPTPDQVAAIQSRRLISLNDIVRACDMPKNPPKNAPYRKDTLSYQTLYAARDVDMPESAYTHLHKVRLDAQRDIASRVLQI